MSSPPSAKKPGEPASGQAQSRGFAFDRRDRSRKGRRQADELAREQALRRESEAARATLRAIFESVPGSYLVLTADDDYRIVGVTEAYLRSTMTERGAIVEQRLFDVFPDDPYETGSDNRRQLAASLERVRQTRKTDVLGIHRYPIRRPEEQGGGLEERYWSSINAPVLDPEGKLAYIIHRVEDVTEFARGKRQDGAPDEKRPSPDSRAAQMEAEIVRRAQDLQKANENLRESEARYHDLIRALPAAVYTCDAEGRVLMYNDAARALWGREPEVGKDLWCGSWRIYRPEGVRLPVEESPMAVAIREGRTTRGEFVIEPDGDARRTVLANATPTFDASGLVTGAVNLLMDITEQSRAEEARSHLAAIVDSSDDAIVSKDLEGVIRSWNHGAERMFGYSEKEMIGQPITRIIPRELWSEEEQLLEKIRRGEPIDHFETVRIAKDGRSLDVSLSISPIHNAAGEVVGASKIGRDITEQKRIVRALAESDRRKDEFLAMLAHELRNPLAAVSSAVELLGMPGGAEHLESSRQMIGRQTRHLVHLVEDLMDMSRISRGIVTLRKEIQDARAVVERAVETVAPQMEARRHELSISVGDEPLWVEGDPTRLEQLLANLLTNAAKFTEPGGLVQVAATRQGDTIEIRVRDNGIGIPQNLLSVVFELFSQSERSADRSAGGLGIGLTLVRSLVELHGGSVEARSEGPGKGSEFMVRLPALEADAIPASLESAAAPAAAAAPPKRVLVVDDNEDAALGLAQLLELSGHTVDRAHSGPAALEAAASFKPDAVLLDIGLPDLDGHEVAKRLRQNPSFNDVLLIAISGYCREDDRQRSREAGFDYHLGKPTDHQELLRLLAGASA